MGDVAPAHPGCKKDVAQPSEERFTPDNPATVFATIWQNAKDDLWRSLLE